MLQIEALDHFRRAKLFVEAVCVAIFDEDKAKEFYVGFLDFKVDWEHRFEENFPLYMQVSSGGCLIHLSEHHGDCSPGSALRIEVENIKGLHAKLTAKNYKFSRPGLGTTPWDTNEICLTDPFGNRIVFFEDLQGQ